ncbi:MAG TPA: ACT domain-containing protein [Anaerolineae bacterium]|nr:ACT domain-containing protein [Anaerolineae bacterium]HMR65329.1 ACT domain-containing protein [Anaerolineae bacterium]
MNVPQISVFVENRPGRLAHLLQILAEAKINIRALSVADSADFGIVRLIVDDPKEAIDAIHAAGMTGRITSVLRVEVPDEPGALERDVVESLAQAGVNIEYMYAYGGRLSGTAVIILKVDNLEKAEQALRKS